MTEYKNNIFMISCMIHFVFLWGIARCLRTSFDLFRQWGNPYFMVAPLSEISRRLFWHDKTTKKSKQNVPDHSKNIVDLEYHKDLGK